MSSEWRTVTLGDAVDVLDSQRRPVNSDERSRRIGDVPYYGANGQQGWIDGALFNEPLILLAEDGGNFDDFATRPIAYRVDGPSWVNNHAHIIRAKRGIDQSFLFWSLVHRDIRRYISGGTRTKLTQAEMRSIELRVPPATEQRMVAEILDAADAQIRLTGELREKWRRARTGIVRDLTGGDWPSCRLGDLAGAVTSGSRGWARYYASEGATFIRIGNLTRAHINLRFESLTRVAVPHGSEGSRTGLQPGDVLISITADLGAIGVVPEDLGEAYINQHIALVRVDAAKANPRWVGHFLSSPRGQRQFQRLNDQGAKAGLNLPTVSNLEVALPSVEEQTRAVAAMDEVDARIAALSDEIVKLTRLRSGLMTDLLSGRVRTPMGPTS